MRGPSLRGILFSVLMLITTASLASGQERPSRHGESGKQAEAERQLAELPSIELDRERGFVDVEGAVSLREGLLELVATVRGGKGHESLFALDARPRHIHLALLLLGLEPGKPGRWIYTEDEVIAVDPTGDRVRATVIYEKDGERVERPVNEFVRDRVSGEQMDSNVFVFAGSRMGKNAEGEPYYVADASGDVISLVSFGDELLATPEAASDSNEELIWEANTEQMPPVGTEVVLRLRPIQKPEDEDQRPKTSEGTSSP